MPTLLPANELVFVPLRVATYQQLLERHGTTANAVIEDQVEAFLERTADDTPKSPRGRGAGVTWETLFLPIKSQIRTRYLGQYRYAEIGTDTVSYNSESFPSVAQAINRMRGDTSNNAWKVTELLRPGDSQWRPASDLRRRG
jgi:hypothetical protein